MEESRENMKAVRDTKENLESKVIEVNNVINEYKAFCNEVDDPTDVRNERWEKRVQRLECDVKNMYASLKGIQITRPNFSMTFKGRLIGSK